MKRNCNSYIFNYPQNNRNKELAKLTDSGIRSFITRFLKRNYLTYRKPTHQGQILPEMFLEKAMLYRNNVLGIIDKLNVKAEGIVNVDETAIYFDPPISKVIDIKGSKSINILRTKGGKRRISLVLALTLSGTKLPPLLIFRGGSKKFLDKKLQKHSSVTSKRVFIICDPKAWCSATAFRFWIDNIWNVYVRTMERSILLLDDNSVHRNLPLKMLWKL